MENICCGLKVGDTVPEFELDTFEPSKGSFGKFRMKEQLKKKHWTVLFFYPASFTFV